MYFLFLVAFFGHSASAGPFAIYGEDNRQDVYAVSNPLFVSLASSTAAMIEKTNLKQNADRTTISGRSLGDMYKLCPDQRFRSQPVAANCSGTLVAPDIIMTAAHCYELAKQSCKEYAWVFDYKVSRDNQDSVTVPTSNVYECQEVILNEMDLGRGIDHALIKLKRPVSDRSFAKLRNQGSIDVGEPLVLIGHPNGLPTKIAADAFVLKLEGHSFVSNVDAFSVNSGSGVFHATTGEVEGILSSGRSDYDGKGNCSSVIKYEMNQGNETVVNVDAVRKFLANYRTK